VPVGRPQTQVCLDLNRSAKHYALGAEIAIIDVTRFTADTRIHPTQTAVITAATSNRTA
jgi:hypothetical protein